MFDWITGLIESSGYWGIAFLMFLENVFPPIPSELIMPMAGYVADQGQMSFIGAIAAGTTGSLLGQLPLYYLGKWVGEERLKKWADKHGHWLAVSPEEIDQAKEWFCKYGGVAVFFCRLVPTARSLISIPAGLTKMSLPKFLAYTLAGTAIWTAALAYAGRLLGENYEQVEKYVNPIGYGILAIIIGLYIWRLYKRRHKIKEEAQGAS